MNVKLIVSGVSGIFNILNTRSLDLALTDSSIPKKISDINCAKVNPKIPCVHQFSWQASIRHPHIREWESCDKIRMLSWQASLPGCGKDRQDGFWSKRNGWKWVLSWSYIKRVLSNFWPRFRSVRRPVVGFVQEDRWLFRLTNFPIAVG